MPKRSPSNRTVKSVATRKPKSPIAEPSEKIIRETKKTISVEPRKTRRDIAGPTVAAAIDRRKQITDERPTKSR